jgi:multiple sugar transport system substrate-binding protein
MRSYHGLTWDHPRGRAALEEAARQSREQTGLDLRWSTHSLEGFESSPIAELAEKYDIIVLDHPHLGEALEHDSLLPLDELFGANELAVLAEQTVGPALDSYVYQGHLWALPLDAATQVGAMRGDLFGDAVVHAPETWSEVDALADQGRVALSLAGPHAFLTFASVCVALGEEPATGDEFISPEIGAAALELLTRLADRAPAESDRLNPIAMLQAMSAGDSIAYCPLIFGYVNYTSPHCDRPLTFVDAPAKEIYGRPGSTIGGTGLALTRRCEPGPELLKHLRWLLAPEIQRVFIPEHEGQPSAHQAWEDKAVNQASDNFYRNTRRTIDQSWVRPRYRGYIQFQTDASALLRSVLAREITPAAGLNELQRLFAASVAGSTASGALFAEPAAPAAPFAEPAAPAAPVPPTEGRPS